MGNGFDNAHDNAFGGGKNPGLGGATGGSSSGGISGNAGNSGSEVNVGFGGSLTVDLGNGLTMTFEGTHALKPGTGGTVGGSSGNAGNGLQSSAIKAQIKKTISPIWATVPGKPGTYAAAGLGAVVVKKSPGVATYSTSWLTTASVEIVVRNGDINNAAINFVNWKGPHGNAATLAKQRAQQYIDYEKAISAVADFYKTLTQLHGDKLAKEAKYFAEQSVGKVIRNKTQALQAFDRYSAVLNKKFSAADRLAIANALTSLNAEKMASQLKLYGKAFGVVGDYIQYSGLVKGLIKGFKTGDWGDAIVSAEGIIISKAAGALAAFAFSAMTASALGILGFTMIMAIMGALITDQLIKQINDFMLSL